MMAFDPGQQLRDGVDDAHWTDTDLWVASIALGGGFSLTDISAITAGDRTPTRGQYDVLAAALNEHFADLGHDRPLLVWAGPSGTASNGPA